MDDLTQKRDAASEALDAAREDEAEAAAAYEERQRKVNEAGLRLGKTTDRSLYEGPAQDLDENWKKSAIIKAIHAGDLDERDRLRELAADLDDIWQNRHGFIAYAQREKDRTTKARQRAERAYHAAEAALIAALAAAQMGDYAEAVSGAVELAEPLVGALERYRAHARRAGDGVPTFPADGAALALLDHLTATEAK